MTRKRYSIAAALTLWLLTSLQCLAGDPINTKKGLALKGYDAVAYFTESKPVRGDKQYQHRWQDVNWLFASAENRDRFAEDPEKYAPQFGGYCAWAVSQGYLYDANPSYWKIVDGKLYLNYNRGAQRRWEGDIPGNIQKGETAFPGLVDRK